MAFEGGEGLGRRLPVPQDVDQVILEDRGPLLEQQDLKYLPGFRCTQLVGSDDHVVAADPEPTQDVNGQPC